ncbi:hypothetical protein [Corynebacterium belfantii]|uniref:Uncharacterized protein n=2 Tax=Corynebacterium belfantii TaxID=2014537 RepID=A0ABS0LGJ1_9CORY|nr:hypothetical protein [Corynebacterium belfantii]OWM39991.1 hypothetical protein AZF07_12195 [Corynebacterium diphtheriae subsp. lausannense]QVI98915.1 hypothetical protein KFR76_01710 [Corynebacterium diphtheriae]MBG9260267.1 hypothetical protein [Corynebacterium belfantii]MBG9267014.1 hypothetical protein [Corynebacterium belfantii]MBG9299277.1 hypothetical protein [Corynebacterium belfantii]
MIHTTQALELALGELRWKNVKGANSGLNLWVPTEGSELIQGLKNIDDLGVFVPLNEDAPDYGRNVQYAVAELSRVVPISLEKLLDEAQLRLDQKLDKVFIHFEDDSTGAGAVNLAKGIDLFSGLKTLLSTGARFSRDQRARYSSSGNVIANNFLESCLLGQTEVGSFIASALIPASKNIKATNNKTKKAHMETTGREITKSMVAALQGTREVLDEYLESPKNEVFEFGISNGVSYEMLEGVEQIVGTKESEISFEFLPLPSDEGEPFHVTPIVFSPEHKRAARKGKEVLSKAPQELHVAVAGEVIELRRTLEDTTSSRIRIRGDIQGKIRTLGASLSASDYEKASRAHIDKRQLFIKGTVKQGVFTEVELVTETNDPVAEERLSSAEASFTLF